MEGPTRAWEGVSSKDELIAELQTRLRASEQDRARLQARCSPALLKFVAGAHS